MENKKRSFDVIVVGAGTGGSTAARLLAQKGVDVCLIDCKERNKVGDKICGDVVRTAIFDFLGIPPPKGAEFSCHIKGTKLYAPNRVKCMTLIDPGQTGCTVNRLEFGQRLLNEALGAGVMEFLDHSLALELLYEDDAVSGLKVRLKNGDLKRLTAKLVMDASGFHSSLRKQAKSSLIEKEIADEDVVVCYREIVDFMDPSQSVMDPDYITIILDQEKAPGGYIWYFPRNESSVNIGLGVQARYGGKVKDFYQNNVFRQFITSDRIRISTTGGGAVPARRPLWSCVDNGLLLIGDAACHVYPLTGEGIAPSMRAGYFASLTALTALDKNDFTSNVLWGYNSQIMTTFGAEFAALDLLRIALQRLSNSNLIFGLSKDLVTGSEIIEISSSGRVQLGLMDLGFKAIRGISNPRLLLRLNFRRVQMNAIYDHYKRFPDKPEGFGEWQVKTDRIYHTVKKSPFG